MESDDECPDLIDMSNNDTHKNSEDRAKVPVTIITGHLGSGKTTLLNYILNEQHNKKVVVRQLVVIHFQYLEIICTC